MSREFLLQDWVTLRGNASGASLTQDEECWLDLEGFSDAACWIDVAEVTPPGASTATSVALALETAAVCDDAYFAVIASPVQFGTATPFNQASSTPILIRSTRAVSASTLARYLRWKITPSASGLWDLTFRVRAVAMRSPAFVPTDLSGCVLWLRADLGIGLAAAPNQANVATWADQSGNGHDASQATTASQPTYSPNAVNGLPAITGNGSSLYMTTSAFSIGSSATMLAVVQPLVTTQSGYTRILEQDAASTYYLGVTLAGTAYKLIVADGTGPYGTAETGTVQLAPSIVSATYSVLTGVGTIYYNAVNPVSYAFGTTPSGTQALYLLRYQGASAGFWNGYLAEAIIYSRALSAADLRRAHRYLGTRYGIAVP